MRINAPRTLHDEQTRGYFADEEKTEEAFRGLIKGEEDSGHVYLQVRP